MRGRFITQRRLQSGSARSLEVKDIPWKNVNGGKATTGAIPRQIIRTTAQGAGPGQSKVQTWTGGADRGGENLSRKGSQVGFKGINGIGEFQSEKIFRAREYRRDKRRIGSHESEEKERILKD